jgi:hypothetical protein
MEPPRSTDPRSLGTSTSVRAVRPGVADCGRRWEPHPTHWDEAHPVPRISVPSAKASDVITDIERRGLQGDVGRWTFRVLDISAIRRDIDGLFMRPDLDIGAIFERAEARSGSDLLWAVASLASSLDWRAVTAASVI